MWWTLNGWSIFFSYRLADYYTGTKDILWQGNLRHTLNPLLHIYGFYRMCEQCRSRSASTYHLIRICTVGFFKHPDIRQKAVILLFSWLKVIKLSMETSLKSHASDWLKWRLNWAWKPVLHLKHLIGWNGGESWDLRLVSMLSFITLDTDSLTPGTI
jgi:hypothetical protein